MEIGSQTPQTPRKLGGYADWAGWRALTYGLTGGDWGRRAGSVWAARSAHERWPPTGCIAGAVKHMCVEVVAGSRRLVKLLPATKGVGALGALRGELLGLRLYVEFLKAVAVYRQHDGVVQPLLSQRGAQPVLHAAELAERALHRAGRGWRGQDDSKQIFRSMQDAPQ